MRYFLDTEFNARPGHATELLSVGLVSEDGRELYRENLGADWDAVSPWVRQHVLPKMSAYPPRGIDYASRRATTWATPQEIAQDLVEFTGDDQHVEIWALYGAFDWVCLIQLFGDLRDLPSGWPMTYREVAELADARPEIALPLKPADAHNALADARWLRNAHRNLVGSQPTDARPKCGICERPVADTDHLVRCDRPEHAGPVYHLEYPECWSAHVVQHHRSEEGSGRALPVEEGRCDRCGERTRITDLMGDFYCDACARPDHDGTVVYRTGH